MDWKVYIEYRPDRLTNYIYVGRKVAPGTYEYLVKGGTEYMTVKEGTAPTADPTYFAQFEDEYIMRLVVEALDKRGIKAPSQSYIEGKYEATTDHLQDLRKLIPKLTEATK